METLRNVNVANSDAFAVKSKGQLRQPQMKQPLKTLNGPIRNLPTKASFKGTTKMVTKSNPKLLRPVVPVKAKVQHEILDSVVEIQESLPDIEPVKLPANIEDIDAEDKENPQLVGCYVKEIYCYLRTLEVRFAIRKNHLSGQPDVNGRMRSVLVDWLVQVHQRFQLLSETLFMTVSILDRFLQVEKVKRVELQLVGVAAMFIASKFEEMYANDIGDFVYITDNSYTKKEILGAEKVILQKLGFNLSKPLAIHFLRRNSKAGDVDAIMHTLSKYLLELSLSEYSLAHCSPSLLGAAACYLSLKLMVQSQWTETLKYYSGYSEEELMPTVRSLCKVVANSEASKTQAVRTKYSSSSLYKISSLPQLKSSFVMKLAADKS